jgi:phosphoribosylformimino-5-aminoimidazole carboxamide ribotide isomerase
MKIIPAIDIIDGKCVRLAQGDYNKKTIYSSDPVEVARSFEDHGITHLHLIDLDGAKTGGIMNYKVLEKIAIATNLIIDFGGGIKQTKDLEMAFNSGASKVTGGSVAVSNPELFIKWIQDYGSDRIILGADCHERYIAINGWQKMADIEVIAFIEQYQSKGIKEVICTDISKDGMLQGASTALYKEILAKTEIQLIASGGVSNISDLNTLNELGCSAAIIGKAIYEGKITLKELSTLC